MFPDFSKSFKILYHGWHPLGSPLAISWESPLRSFEILWDVNAVHNELAVSGLRITISIYTVSANATIGKPTRRSPEEPDPGSPFPGLRPNKHLETSRPRCIALQKIYHMT
jgi:hypothetical protein